MDELITKAESSHVFSVWLDEACQQFGINSQYYCWWKKQFDHVTNHASSNMRKTHPGHPGLLVPLDDLLLSMFLSFPSKEWSWQHELCLERYLICVEFFVPDQMMQSCWLCIGGWRHRDWGTEWVQMNLSTLLQRQHQMHLISCRR